MKLHLSYFKKKTTVTFHNKVVEVKPFQIIVWVSVANDFILEWDAKIPRIPAILDIGNNHNFGLSEGHLAKWAGVQAASLPELQLMRDKGVRVQLHAASLWLHTDSEPFKLEIDEGIGVYEAGAPRLPILGLRALTNNKLQTLICGDIMRVIIRTRPKWYWPF